MPFLNSFDSFVFAFILNVVFIGLKLYQDAVRDDPLWEYRTPTLTDTCVYVAEFAVLAVCVLNTVYMFRRSKKLLLFRQPTVHSGLIRSPNAKIVSVDVTGAEYDDVDEQVYEQPARTWKDKILFWKKPKAVRPQNLRRVWQLTVWDPSPFAISLFCSFSPLQLAILHNITCETWGSTIPVASLCALLLHFVVDTFQTHLKDKEIVAGQVLHEFSQDMSKMENFPPERKFDIETRGDSQPALVTPRRVTFQSSPQVALYHTSSPSTSLYSYSRRDEPSNYDQQSHVQAWVGQQRRYYENSENVAPNAQPYSPRSPKKYAYQNPF
ncbi:hypothetical protein SpCBS45565_g02663 [Spizellomyces sp. 'palustris']|nr:hypothetical protein SpCBS45565_g02663 [Spizellomyces sp. 'palustris']